MMDVLLGGISTTKMADVVKVCLGFAAICLLVDVIVSQGMSPVENQFIEDTTNRFSQLSASEMLDAWHTECHRRCNYQLTWHIELACRFDPYKTGRRRRRSIETPRNMTHILHTNSNVKVTQNDVNASQPVYPKDPPQFMPRNAAVSFLNDRSYKRTKRGVSITRECCSHKACSWEEFAEYCNRHPRRGSERDSVCAYN